MKANFLALAFFALTVSAVPIDTSVEPPAPTTVSERIATITNSIKMIPVQMEKVAPSQMVYKVGRTIHSFLPEGIRTLNTSNYMPFENVVSSGMIMDTLNMFSRRSNEL